MASIRQPREWTLSHSKDHHPLRTDTLLYLVCIACRREKNTYHMRSKFLEVMTTYNASFDKRNKHGKVREHAPVVLVTHSLRQKRRMKKGCVCVRGNPRRRVERRGEGGGTEEVCVRERVHQ